MLFYAVIAMVLCVGNQTQSKLPSRDEIVEEFTRWRKGLLSEFYIKYDVKRRIVHESGPYDYVPGGTVKKEHSLMMHWGGEHAWRGGDFRRDITIANPTPGDFESQCIIAKFSFKDRMIVATKRRVASIGERGRSRTETDFEFLPEEELFLEAIGFENRCQDVCVTLRGYKNAHKYDILKAITSPDYSMTSSTVLSSHGSKPQRLFRFELSGVDSFTLSEAYGCAMIKRKWIWPDGSNGKGAFVEIENSNWSKVDDTVWIPFKSQIRYFSKLTAGGSPELALEETIVVSAASTRTSDKLFLPKLQNGAAVVMPNGRRGATFRGDGPEDFLRYMLDPTGSEQEDQAKSARHIRKGGRFFTRFRILIIVNALLLAALAVLVYYRMTHKRAR